MELGARCDTVYNMYAGKVQEHKEGMCPVCLKARAGPYRQPMGILEYQSTPDVKMELQPRSQDLYTQRYGRPTSGRTSGHPASKPSGRGCDDYTGLDIPQYPVQLAPQLLPQNLAAHTPVPPLPPPLRKKSSKKAHYTFPNAGERSILEVRPVFEPPSRRELPVGANGKQGVGTRKMSPQLTRTRRLQKSSDEDDELELKDHYDHQPPKIRARAQTRGQTHTQSVASGPTSQPSMQSVQQPQPALQNDLYLDNNDYDSYNNPYGFRTSFFEHLNDHNQPTELSQPLEIYDETQYIQPQQLHQLQESAQQLYQLQHAQTQGTRSQYPDDVTYGAYEGGNGINGTYSRVNTGYNPPIFGQNYPLAKPTAILEQEVLDTYGSHGSGFTSEKLLLDEVDWDKIAAELENSDYFIVPALEYTSMEGIETGLTSQGIDIPGSIYLDGRMQGLEMQPQQAYTFPGSTLPMPVVNTLGQRTEVVDRIVEKADPEEDCVDDPMSPLFPDD